MGHLKSIANAEVQLVPKREPKARERLMTSTSKRAWIWGTMPRPPVAQA